MQCRQCDDVHMLLACAPSQTHAPQMRTKLIVLRKGLSSEFMLQVGDVRDDHNYIHVMSSGATETRARCTPDSLTANVEAVLSGALHDVMLHSMTLQTGAKTLKCSW
jgi:hypothetical protein